jgi:tetratricopeptide (TPR) repeat protein
MKTVLALALLLGAFPASARRGADPLDAKFAAVDEQLESGNYAKARETLDGLLIELKADDPRLVRYHERSGASWLQEDDVHKALVYFTTALKEAQRLKVVDDSAAKAYTGMGVCLRRQGKDKYALRFFRKAIALPLDEGTRIFVEDQIREIQGAPPVPVS